MPAAEMPMPCCPRLMRSRWNLDPYSSFAKIGGICWRTIPGPLSVTVIRKRLAWLTGGGASPLATASTLTTTSGRIPASSQASRALSTASLTQVRSAFRGLSNPRGCRFLVKNSEAEISRVALRRLVRGSQTAQQVGPRGMQQVIPVEVAGGGELVDEREGRPRALHHGDRRRAIQGDDGRGLQALEHVVEPDDLGPVRVLGPRRLAVQGRDRRLQRERTGPAPKRLLDERQRFGDLLVIPAATILLVQKDEIADRVETRVAPCVVQQHDGRNGGPFLRCGRLQSPQQAPYP